MDFQYALTKQEKKKGTPSHEADVRLLLEPGSRATRRTSLRISSLATEAGALHSISLTAKETLALLDKQEEIASFLNSQCGLPKKRRVGVLHEKHLEAFFLFHSGSRSSGAPPGLVALKNSEPRACPNTGPSVLRKSVAHKKTGPLRKYCDHKEHTHALLETETMVVDHILELQLLHALNQSIQLPKPYLKKVVNQAWNLQLLGSLQNRAKAWVVLKYLQRKESKNKPSRCNCLRCVATSLLPREHLRCAGSLRSLAHEESFGCFIYSFERAWKSFLAKLAASGFEREHDFFRACSEDMLVCRAT